MAKFEVKNSEGKKVAEAELAAEVYGIEPNIHVMHHIVKCQMASWRQGTQSAKGRSVFHCSSHPFFCMAHRKNPSMPVRVGTESAPCSPAVIPAGSATAGFTTVNSG